MKIDINEENLNLLIPKFTSTLRPRGEILFRLKEFENIFKYMIVSDEEFIRQTGVSE